VQHLQSAITPTVRMYSWVRGSATRGMNTWSPFSSTMDHPFKLLVRGARATRSGIHSSQSGRAVSKKASVSWKLVRSSFFR
jgi:hypothetical protein